jgi:hypothetical protein
LIESLPPAGSDVMVVRSLRLPLDLDQAVAAAAKAAEMPKTTWIPTGHRDGAGRAG